MGIKACLKAAFEDGESYVENGGGYTLTLHLINGETLEFAPDYSFAECEARGYISTTSLEYIPLSAVLFVRCNPID